ncbi:MAG TPA: hypothetical protein VFA04_11665 [Bryobacteraceae bacterium]|nr:hypothetical protein [Bryobacteraceae bacterium]
MMESAVQTAASQSESAATAAVLNGVPVAQIRAELDRILRSRVFIHSHRIRRFLQFVVEECLNGRHHRLKEYLIGMEVFNREESFDPRVDSIVRVEARRLRAKLEEYYAAEGAANELRVHLRKGSYVPVFETAARARMAAAGAPATRAWRRSIAVLPFSVGDGASPALAEDIHRHLIHHLTPDDALQVMSRRPGEPVDGVRADYLLSGSISADGGVPRLLLQLLEGAEHSYLFSQEVECPAGDLSFLDDVCSNVRRAIINPAPGGEAVRQSDNKESFASYLQGMYALKASKPGAFSTSRNYFSRAVEMDPEYGAAWASLAQSLVLVCLLESGDHDQFCAQARDAAAKAVSLTEALPEAHTAHGLVLSFLDWQWNEGARELQNAICLDKSSALAHVAFGVQLAARGRLSDARAEFGEAERLDPVSLLAHFCVGWGHTLESEYDEAMSRFRLIALLEPDFAWSYLGMGWACAGKGQYAEAIAHFTNVSHLLQSRFLFSGPLGYCYAMSGRRDEALRLLSKLAESARTQHVPAVNYASIYAGLGDRERAFEYLDQSAAAHESALPILLLGPEFNSLRSDERFARLREKMGIAEA